MPMGIIRASMVAFVLILMWWVMGATVSAVAGADSMSMLLFGVLIVVAVVASAAGVQ